MFGSQPLTPVGVRSVVDLFFGLIYNSLMALFYCALLAMLPMLAAYALTDVELIAQIVGALAFLAAAFFTLRYIWGGGMLDCEDPTVKLGQLTLKEQIALVRKYASSQGPP